MYWENVSYDIVKFDMRTLQLSQVLEYTLPDSTGENFKWSKQGRMLNVVCSSSHPDRCWYLQYALYRGQALKELALNVVVEDFSIKRIQASNIPHSLF